MAGKIKTNLSRALEEKCEFLIAHDIDEVSSLELAKYSGHEAHGTIENRLQKVYGLSPTRYMNINPTCSRRFWCPKEILAAIRKAGHGRGEEG